MKISLQKHLRWISMVIMLGPVAGFAQEKVTCKASVVFRGQELSGRMMFKQVAPDTVKFAFFNELGMSFVEGSVSVSGQRSAVSGQQSAVSGQRSAVSGQQSAVSGQRSAVSGQEIKQNGKRQTANGKRSAIEISKISSFLDHKSFTRNLERALKSFLWDHREEKIHLPVIEDKSVDMTLIYKRGRKFVLKLQLAKFE